MLVQFKKALVKEMRLIEEAEAEKENGDADEDTNESSDGFEELSQLLRERAARRQRLHEAAVQLTVAIAALDRIVSSLLDVGGRTEKDFRRNGRTR